MGGWGKEVSVCLVIWRLVGLVEGGWEGLEVSMWGKGGEVGWVGEWVR